MAKERFTVTRYDYEVDYEASDSALVSESLDSADLSEALEALNSDCWDNVDERESEVILRPADWHKDIRTGEVTYTDVIISADKPQNLTRLLNYWRQQTEGRQHNT